MINIFILLPVVAVITAVAIVYFRDGFAIRPIIVTALLTALISGAITAGFVQYVVVAHPETNVEIQISNGGGNTNSKPAPGERDMRGNVTAKKSDKWSGDFWEQYTKKKR